MLQPIAPVHEAFLRLVGPLDVNHWDSRSHLFAAAAAVMRRILVDRARAKASDKCGGQSWKLDIDAVDLVATVESSQLVMIDEALGRLAIADASGRRSVVNGARRAGLGSDALPGKRPLAPRQPGLRIGNGDRVATEKNGGRPVLAARALLYGHSGFVYLEGFSADGKRLVTSGPRRARTALSLKRTTKLGVETTFNQAMAVSWRPQQRNAIHPIAHPLGRAGIGRRPRDFSDYF